MTVATDHSTDAGPSPIGIWQLGISVFARHTILAAAELGVFTLCDTEALTEHEIRARLSLHPRGSKDFLDALVALEMLERTEGRYRSTPVASRFLDVDKPSYLGRFLRMADARWSRLVEGLRTGEPQNGTRNTDAMFTEQYKDDISVWRSYMVGMDYLTAPLGPRVAEVFDWKRIQSFVDVGGGRGSVAAAIAEAHEHLTCGVLDLPQVRQIFDEHVATLGMTERISFHGGNFFSDRLPTVDALLFGHVLHDWSERERRSLVAAAFEALPPGGWILVYDPMIDDNRSHRASSLLVSLNMLLATPGGSEYTAADCFGWLAEVGFVEPHVARLDDHDSLVTARKPENG
jgi:SAM-dependent methyltransferase